MELFETIGRLFESDPLSGIVLAVLAIQWLHARNQERDDQNTTNAIALASAVVTTFEPVKTLLQKMIDRIDGKHEQTQAVINQRFDQADTTMSGVTQKRDDQHAEVIRRLDEQGAEINKVAHQITDETDENTLRHEMNKLILSTGDLIAQIKNVLKTPTEKPTQEPIEEAK